MAEIYIYSSVVANWKFLCLLLRLFSLSGTLNKLYNAHVHYLHLLTVSKIAQISVCLFSIISYKPRFSIDTIFLGITIIDPSCFVFPGNSHLYLYYSGWSQDGCWGHTTRICIQGMTTQVAHCSDVGESSHTITTTAMHNRALILLARGREAISS